MCHTLINLDILSNHRGLTDHNTGTVVDKKIFSDRCSRMDVDPGQAVCMFGHHTRDQRHTEQIEFMCNTVDRDRIHTRIRKDDFIGVKRSRIALVSCLDIGRQHITQLRDLLQKTVRDLSCTFHQGLFIRLTVLAAVRQCHHDLLGQVILYVFQKFSDMIFDRIFSKIFYLKIARKKDLANHFQKVVDTLTVDPAAAVDVLNDRIFIITFQNSIYKIFDFSIFLHTISPSFTS